MSESLRFMKVEDFFRGIQDWARLGDVESYRFDQKRELLTLEFHTGVNGTSSPSLMLLQFPRKEAFRVRFNPGKSALEDYPIASTSSLRAETFQVLSDALPDHTLECQELQGRLELTTFEGRVPFMKVRVNLRPFSIDVYKFDDHAQPCLILAGAVPSIHFRKNVVSDSTHLGYSVVQVEMKPPTAKYVGFGEHGGSGVYKNSVQQTFFNYDNFLYKKVVGRGPLDDREPLYDSNPFFMEVNGTTHNDAVY